MQFDYFIIGKSFNVIGELYLLTLNRQAKTLSKSNLAALVCLVQSKRHPIRNKVVVFLSAKAGLRAKEIAHLTWAMMLNPDGGIGSHIALPNSASKGSSGRHIPINRDLREALEALYAAQANGNPKAVPSGFVIKTERQDHTTAQAIVNQFIRWYRELGLIGCSSHSGRRTFITNAARKISTVGGSLRDVQQMAGHKSLNTTQRYIESDQLAQAKVVDLI